MLLNGSQLAPGDFQSLLSGHEVLPEPIPLLLKSLNCLNLLDLLLIQHPEGMLQGKDLFGEPDLARPTLFLLISDFRLPLPFSGQIGIEAVYRASQGILPFPKRERTDSEFCRFSLEVLLSRTKKVELPVLVGRFGLVPFFEPSQFPQILLNIFERLDEIVKAPRVQPRAFTISSVIFLASPRSIIVLSR